MENAMEMGKTKHPNKPARWIFKRYFTRYRNENAFYADIKDRRNRKDQLHLEKMSHIPIVRHVKVKGNASPDDPDLIMYWETRRTKTGRQLLARGGKLYRIAERQSWKCSGCNEALFNGRPVDIHHIIPIENGGTDDEENLIWLHEVCHYNRHRRKVA
jgi:HNH endonuclease.